METRTLLLGHSPDPDDAFMFYALAADRVPSGHWRFEHILEDIQSLNERALLGALHISAISVHAYPHVQGKYSLLNCGSSMGDGYGPMVVASRPMSLEDLKGTEILIPGEMTTAFLVLSLVLGRGSFDSRVVMFDQIISEIAAGRAQAGLIIHEGQLTFQKQNLHKIVDLGEWWRKETQLPLPLGGNVIRRDLGESNMREIAGILKASIEYGLAHRSEAISYALDFARDMGADLADRFVGMYVNKWTLDYGDIGRQAVRELLRRGSDVGIVPRCGEIDFV